MLEFDKNKRLINLVKGKAQTPEQIALIPKIEALLKLVKDNISWKADDMLVQLFLDYFKNEPAPALREMIAEFDKQTKYSYMLDGKLVDVLPDGAFYCEGCKEYHSLQHTSSHLTSEGYLVCDRIMADHVTECRVCHRKFLHIYDTFECMCKQCVEETRKYRIKRYHDNPVLEFYNENGRTDETNGHYYGIELEIDRGGESNDISKDVIKLMQERVYTMHDGSLENGFEIITHPHTEQALYNLNWKETFKWLIHKGYRSHDIPTCGLHLHINRSLFNNEESLAKMLYFYEKNFEEVIKVSRRDINRVRRWAGSYFNNDNDITMGNMHSILIRYDRQGYHDYRYKCVNLQKRNTVEIRIMRGTLNYNSFMACLDFMITVAKNSNKVTNIDSWEEWLDGINDNTKAYLGARRAFGYPPEIQDIEDDCYNMTSEEIRNMEEEVCAL